MREYKIYDIRDKQERTIFKVYFLKRDNSRAVMLVPGLNEYYEYHDCGINCIVDAHNKYAQSIEGKNTLILVIEEPTYYK